MNSRKQPVLDQIDSQVFVVPKHEKVHAGTPLSETNITLDGKQFTAVIVFKIK